MPRRPGLHCAALLRRLLEGVALDPRRRAHAGEVDVARGGVEAELVRRVADGGCDRDILEEGRARPEVEVPWRSGCRGEVDDVERVVQAVANLRQRRGGYVDSCMRMRGLCHRRLTSRWLRARSTRTPQGWNPG